LQASSKLLPAAKKSKKSKPVPDPTTDEESDSPDEGGAGGGGRIWGEVYEATMEPEELEREIKYQKDAVGNLINALGRSLVTDFVQATCAKRVGSSPQRDMLGSGDVRFNQRRTEGGEDYTVGGKLGGCFVGQRTSHTITSKKCYGTACKHYSLY